MSHVNDTFLMLAIHSHIRSVDDKFDIIATVIFLKLSIVWSTPIQSLVYSYCKNNLSLFPFLVVMQLCIYFTKSKLYFWLAMNDLIKKNVSTFTMTHHFACYFYIILLSTCLETVSWHE